MSDDGYDTDEVDMTPAEMRAEWVRANARRLELDPFTPFFQFRVRLTSGRLAFSPDWRTTIRSSRPKTINQVRGVITGSRSGITVLDVKLNSQFYSELSSDLLRKTLKVDTPNRGVHLYFEFDSRLNSIYETLPGVSVLNEDRFVFAGGPSYVADNKESVVKAMPSIMFDKLYAAQLNPAEVNEGCYEILSLLNPNYFDNLESMKRLVLVVRNAESRPDVALATLCRVYAERVGWPDCQLMSQLIEDPLTYAKKRITLGQLKREVKTNLGEDEYERRLALGRPRVDPYPRLRHTPGTTMMLSEIKVVYPGLTAKKLLAVNAEFTSRRAYICRLCNELHHRDCCDASTSSTRVQRTVINNISIE